ncbi:MAG: response regulator [Bacteroidota bacterium]
MEKKIKVYLIDDRDIIRDTLKLFLNRYKDVEIIGEADSGEDAKADLQDKNPDVILTDIHMPFMNGYELMDWLKKEKSESKVLVMSVNNEDQYVRRSLDKGAQGFFVKNDPLQELYKAIRQLFEGSYYLSESILYLFTSRERMVDYYFKGITVAMDENEINSFQKKRLLMR